MRLTERELKKLGAGREVVIRGPGTKTDTKEAKQALFLAACRAQGLPDPIPEYKFHEHRRWRFDWCWWRVLDEGVYMVGMEIQGGLFIQGRHTQGAALLKEYEKINEAQLLGWKVLLVTPKQVDSGEAFALARRALGL